MTHGEKMTLDHDHESVLPHRSRGLAAVLVFALLALGCAQPTQELEPVRPTAPVQPAPKSPSATLPDGSPVALELAITPEELATGLMFRPALAADRGMLLLFDREGPRSIWMKNTLISLDLLYLDDSGVVVHLIEGVPPCAADPCPSYAPQSEARAVLEMAKGAIETHGLVVGDRLSFERVPGYPVAEAVAESVGDVAEGD